MPAETEVDHAARIKTLLIQMLGGAPIVAIFVTIYRGMYGPGSFVLYLIFAATMSFYSWTGLHLVREAKKFDEDMKYLGWSCAVVIFIFMFLLLSL